MKLAPIFSALLLAVAARGELKTDIVFATAGGTNLTLDAFVPAGDGPFPACILVHGGGWTKGDKTTFIKPLFEPLSQAGFTWFTINYRLAPQHRYPACIEDIESAIRWVKAHAAEYKADPQRLALIGESAGGHLVSLAGVRAQADTRVAAVVPFYAPHDMELQAKQGKTIPAWVTALFGLTELNDPAWKILREASPINHIRSGLPPYLLIHGTKDVLVPFDQSLKFQEKTKAAGNASDLITIEGGGHGMGGWEKIDPSYKGKMIAWLRKMLTVSVTENKNLLKNADFSLWEKDKPAPKYWWLEPGPTIAVSKTDGLQVQVQAARKGDGRICNSFDVEPQATYLLTAQIKGSVDKIGYLQIEFLVGGNELKSMPRLVSQNSGTEWTDVAVNIATKEAKRFSVVCRWEQTARTAGQSAWFRNLKLVKVGGTAAGENPSATSK